MTRVLALLALVLLGAFFLPWFGADLGQVFDTSTGVAEKVSGYKLLRSVIELTLQASDVGAPDAFNQSFKEFWPLWLLAAIPLFGLLTLLAGDWWEDMQPHAESMARSQCDDTLGE